MNMLKSTVSATNSLKKFKVSNVVKVTGTPGAPGAGSSQTKWRTSTTQKIGSDGENGAGPSGTIIPKGKLKLNGQAASSARPGSSMGSEAAAQMGPDGKPVRSNSKVTKIKLARRPSQSKIMKVIDDP